MIRIRRTLTALAAVALLAPAIADGSWTIKGRGFGHGVGLSQYGAYGFAKHGKGYEAILEHYYSRTRVGGAGGEKVRVLLGSGGQTIGFTGAGAACGESIKPSRSYSFTREGGGVALHAQNGERVASCGKEGKAVGRGNLRIGRFGRYRGDFIARATDDSVMVINALGLEAYVKGVVPNEVPADWPKQALRAQAVVARSYGLATERGGAFDHYADTRSQVYEGRASEAAATNQAVEATAKQVVEYRGEPAITYYFSTSGGRTENSEFGFAGGNPVPYLKSVKDPYDDASPVHTWSERLSDDQMESDLSGLYSGKLQRIEVTDRGKSPRIVTARVVGSGGSTSVSGDTLRSRLGLRSTWAKFDHR